MTNFQTSKLLSSLLALLLLIGFSTESKGDDWPHWRGPKRDDISKETGLQKSWPKDGPKQVWVNESAGLGYAGFSIVDGKLFTMGLENDQEFALCLDANTGKEIWRVDQAGKFKNGWGDGPRSTPSVDGDHVYFMFAGGTLACLNIKNGKEVWSIEMSDFGGKVPVWGYAESPLVDGDKVIVTPGGPQGAVLAVDKKTGKKIWQSTDFKIEYKGRRGMDDRAHYSSVMPAEFNGKKTYVQLVPNAVVGLDAASGSVIWKSEWNGQIAVIPTPVVFGNKVYICSGYGVGSKLVEIEKDNSAEEAWKTSVMKNHHGGVVMMGDHVYGYCDGAGFTCQNMEDGEIVWNNKKDVKKGAVSFADGMFYFIEEQGGKVMLLSANAEKMAVKGEFQLSPLSERRSRRGKIWVHPVIANGKLYLRDQEIIHCYDIKASQSKP